MATYFPYSQRRWTLDRKLGKYFEVEIPIQSMLLSLLERTLKPESNNSFSFFFPFLTSVKWSKVYYEFFSAMFSFMFLNCLCSPIFCWCWYLNSHVSTFFILHCRCNSGSLSARTNNKESKDIYCTRWEEDAPRFCNRYKVAIYHSYSIESLILVLGDIFSIVYNLIIKSVPMFLVEIELVQPLMMKEKKSKYSLLNLFSFSVFKHLYRTNRIYKAMTTSLDIYLKLWLNGFSALN